MVSKECANCGKKIGLITGNHFDGLLCDNCYNKFGGMLLFNLETERTPNKYIECYNTIAKAIDEKASPNLDGNRIKQEFYKSIDSMYKRLTGFGIQEYIQNEERAKEKELQHIDYAKSFNEFYEYDVVTIINEDHGVIDKKRMMNILSKYSRNGWKLHTIYSNELGKNALSIMGFGSNTTASEDVMIFERRIQEIDS